MIKQPNIMFKRYTTLRYYLQNLKNYDDFTTQAYLYKVGKEHFRKYVDIKRKNVEYNDNTCPDLVVIMQNPSFNNLQEKNQTVEFDNLNSLEPDITLKALISIIDDEQTKEIAVMNWIRIINLSDYEHSDSKKFIERFEHYENTFQESHSIFGKGREEDLKNTMKLGKNTYILIAWGTIAQQETQREMAFQKLQEAAKPFNNKIIGWKSVFDEKQKKLCWRYKYQRQQKIYQEIVKKQKEKQENKEKNEENKEENEEDDDDSEYKKKIEDLQVLRKKYDPELQKDTYGYHHPLCSIDSNQKPYFSFKTKICEQINPNYKEKNENPVENLEELSEKLKIKKQLQQNDDEDSDEEEKKPKKRQRRVLKTEFEENRPKREIYNSLTEEEKQKYKEKFKKKEKSNKKNTKISSKKDNKLKQLTLQEMQQKKEEENKLENSDNKSQEEKKQDTTKKQNEEGEQEGSQKKGYSLRNKKTGKK